MSGRWLPPADDAASAPRRYFIALMIFACAVMARALLEMVLPGRIPFLTFFPALLLVAYYSGLWPSLLVLILSAATGAWLFEVPAGGGTIYRSLVFLLFIIAGGANIAVVLSLVRTFARLRERDLEFDLVNRELKHRLKNVFAVTDAICRQTIRTGGTAAEMSHSVSGRIRAIAAAEDALSLQGKAGTDLHRLVGAVVYALSPAPSRILVDGPPVGLPDKATTAFSLILHELGTNAVKYGAWHGDDGIVAISWSVADRALHFRWQERDGPHIAPPTREGLGSTLIKQGLPGATVQHHVNPDGLDCRITLPL